jgi:hypothetical protein
MLLTDQQWAQLEAIFSRIQLDVSGRQALLIPIARSVGMNVAESPFAIWLTIAGARDFFVIMRNVIQTAEEPSLEKALLVGLKSNALNLEDKSTLTSWLESPSQHKRTGSFTITEDVIGNLSISHDAKSVLRQSIQLVQQNAIEKEQVVLKTISKALSCARDLASNLVDSGKLNLVPDANCDAIAKALLDSELPIKLLDDIVSHWAKFPTGFRFIKEDAPEFQLIKDILVLESLPTEDRSQFRFALLEASDQVSGQLLSSELDVSVQKEDGRMLDYIEKLIRQTWLSLTLNEEDLSGALRILLNPKRADIDERQQLLRRVRFVEEPSKADDNQYRNGLTENSIAEHLINALAGRERKVEKPVVVLKWDLDRMSKENELVVIKVADKRELQSYLDLLKKSFPSVKTLCLGPYEGERYSEVTHHLEWIEQKTPKEYK